MFFAIFSLAFAAAAIRSILFWISYLQRKQYRLDRLWSAMKQEQYWRIYTSPYRYAVLALFIAWQFGVRWFQVPILFDVLFIAAGLLFALQAIQGAAHARKRTLELPVFTAKALGITAAVLGVELLLLRWPWLDTDYAYAFHIISPEHALLLELIQPFLVFAVFAVFFLPNLALQKHLLARATAKRKAMTKLQVVGITGSYGKTTMKEYVAHLLGTKSLVLKTPSHVNVDTGVAKQILQELTPHHTWYVVEMGAYRPGEIASLCNVAQPGFGIITALSNQHVELFGSLERLRKAKFELVDAINDASKLFMNAESPSLVEACRERGINPIWYGRDKRAKLQPMDISFDLKGIHFSIQGQRFDIPGFGTATLVNVLGAITFCHEVGMSLTELAHACKSLPVIQHTMELRQGKHGCTVIDSTYNANTQGVIQAVKDMDVLAPKKRKLIVFKDIIELGDQSEDDHKRIALAFAEANADVIFLPSPWTALMGQTLSAVRPGKVYSPEQAQALLSAVGPDTAVLCLGRDAQPYMEQNFL